MIKENMYTPYEIEVEIVNECPLRERTFNYFQMVYVVSGHGRQWVNNNVTDYMPGDLFLLTPDDSHSFEVEALSEFLLIKFNNFYIHDKALGIDNIQRMEYILSNAKLKIGCVMHNKSDRRLVESITRTMIEETSVNKMYSKDLIQQLMNTLIIVVARNMAIHLPKKIKETTDTKIVDILQYIQANIYHPEKVRINAISKALGFSDTYISRYFKKHTTETLQQYITNYRINLIENRLMYSNMRIG